jgi:hypothetical protein
MGEIHYVTYQTAPITKRNPCGTIEEGWFKVDGDTVILTDRWGTAIGDFKRKLNGENPASVAKQLLRSKVSRRDPKNFDRPLNYPDLGLA